MMQRTFLTAAIIGFILVAAPQFSFGQTTDSLAAEVEALKKGQEALQQDITKILEILEEVRPQKPKPFEPLSVSLDGVPFKGDPNAKVTIVEFTDYQCPFCSRHTTQTLPQLLKEYVETGKVRYYLREFPLKSIHPQAAKAAEAAQCAKDQGKYWEMHDVLFQNQRRLSDLDLLGYAEKLTLEPSAFRECLNSGKYTARVDADLQAGMAGGVAGTPSFFLGLTDPNDDSKIMATEFLRGAQPYAAFKNSLDKLLAD